MQEGVAGVSLYPAMDTGAPVAVGVAAQRIDHPLVGLKYLDHALPMRRTKARPASSSATQTSNDGAHSEQSAHSRGKGVCRVAEVAPPIHPSLAWRASSTLSSSGSNHHPAALKGNAAVTFRVRSLGPHSAPTAVVALDTGGRSCYAMRQRPRGCRWPRRPGRAGPCSRQIRSACRLGQAISRAPAPVGRRLDRIDHPRAGQHRGIGEFGRAKSSSGPVASSHRRFSNRWSSSASIPSVVGTAMPSCASTSRPSAIASGNRLAWVRLRTWYRRCLRQVDRVAAYRLDRAVFLVRLVQAPHAIQRGVAGRTQLEEGVGLLRVDAAQRAAASSVPIRHNRRSRRPGRRRDAAVRRA